MKTLENCPQMKTYFTAQSEIFSTADWPKTIPNLIFCSIKRDLYIMTLGLWMYQSAVTLEIYFRNCFTTLCVFR